MRHRRSLPEAVKKTEVILPVASPAPIAPLFMQQLWLLSLRTSTRVGVGLVLRGRGGEDLHLATCGRRTTDLS